MGMLVCPLCCDDQFSNHLSLRNHLLGVVKNVHCPDCKEKFRTILELALHLDGKCAIGTDGIRDEEISKSNDHMESKRFSVREENSKNIFHEKESMQMDEDSRNAESRGKDDENPRFPEVIFPENSISHLIKVEIDEEDRQINDTEFIEFKTEEQCERDTSSPHHLQMTHTTGQNIQQKVHSQQLNKHLRVDVQEIMEEDSELPEVITDQCDEDKEKSIPIKSKEIFERAYEEFRSWKMLNHINIVNEEVMLAYMLHLSKNQSCSSLRSKYSMIKSVLLIHENVNISHFCRVTEFIKKQTMGYEYEHNQSQMLSRDDTNQFMMEASDEEDPSTKEIIEEDESVENLSIPLKSREKYEKEYLKFCSWRQAMNVRITNETVLLEFISEQSKVFAPSSLWCLYSKLKTMLLVKEKIDVSSFTGVVDFLKKMSVGFEAKKSNVLKRSEIDEFLLKAPDDTYLLMKIVTIFGVFGGCRRRELHDLCVGDVKTEGSVLIVHIRDTKTYKSRTFTVVPDGGPVNYVALYEKYISLRPTKVKCNNLFLFYRGGKCSIQPVGVNTFGKYAMEIAKFLNLPNPSSYTGDCFRRTSAAIQATKYSSTSDHRQRDLKNSWKQLIMMGKSSPETCVQKKTMQMDEDPHNAKSCEKDDEIHIFPEVTFQEEDSVLDPLQFVVSVEDRQTNDSECIEFKTVEQCERDTSSPHHLQITHTTGQSIQQNVHSQQQNKHLGVDEQRMMVGGSDVNCEFPKVVTDKYDEKIEKSISVRSQDRYERAYEEFCTWKTSNDMSVVNEDVLLAYMLHLSKKMKCSSSLWSQYSMIKSTLLVHENINISPFCKVTDFIKQQQRMEYELNQSKTLTRNNMKRFMMEASDEEYLLTKEIMGEEAVEKLLIPLKSKEAYAKEYVKFCSWREAKNVEITNETVILTFLSEQSKILAPSSLWCMYSKLKTMLRVKEKIDVSSFTSVSDFLKKFSVGFEAKKSKKSNMLKRSEIDEFLLKAPDDNYLLMKVVTIFGVFGACSRNELHDLCIGDVKTEGNVLVVHIRDTRAYKSRTFTILPDGGPVNYMALYEKYISLRPKKVKCNNLFLLYRGGKCSVQPVGVNTFSKYPMEIAKFLKLSNPLSYTGNCFRKSSATIQAMTELKRHEGWMCC